MLGPIILALASVALIAYRYRRVSRTAALVFLIFDLAVALVVLAGIACYAVAPKHVRPTRRVRLLPRPETPRRTMFRPMLRVR